MKMDHGAHLGLVTFGAVDVPVNGQKVLERKFVGPFHQQPLAAPRLECRTG